MRVALKELSGSHVITVEAGTTQCALEFAKLSRPFYCMCSSSLLSNTDNDM